MSDTPKPLNEKIRDWLESQGYPLEMFVAKSFSKAGYRVIQSDYYDDAESGDSRELDVNASVQSSVGDVLVRIKFVVECKSSSKPWLLFTPARGIAPPGRVAQRGCSKLGRKFLRELTQNPDIQSLPLFEISDKPAYGITQAFTTGHDIAYNAAVSVSKAAAAQIADAEKYTSLGHPYCLLVFPVIVVDSPLFDVSLREDGEIEIRPIDSGVLIWRNRVMHNLQNIITIIHKDKVTDFARNMRPSCDTLFEHAAESIPRWGEDPKSSG